MQLTLPFVDGNKSGEYALGHSSTLGEYLVIECCRSTSNATLCPSTTCKSLHLIMLSPSPISGTLCFSWRRWIYLQEKLSTVDRCLRNPHCGSRTSAPGGAKTHVPGVLDLTTAGVISQSYPDTTGKWHYCWAHLIQIIKMEETVASKCSLANKQFHKFKVKFPLTHQSYMENTDTFYHQEAPKPLLDAELPCP